MFFLPKIQHYIHIFSFKSVSATLYVRIVMYCIEVFIVIYFYCNIKAERT